MLQITDYRKEKGLQSKRATANLYMKGNLKNKLSENETGKNFLVVVVVAHSIKGAHNNTANKKDIGWSRAKRTHQDGRHT